ncbi:MAG: outer membrane beta-barrel protein [Paludibacteraceae bacterium]|nr:outer membrane beta-barrel protein [Paludibacteraceae bacterium]MDY5651497.1 outer membrane beta-barrel protein [Paludibacteraceae bacterium]
MHNKRFILIFALCSLLFAPISAQRAMNRPYVDDQLFHFGFQLGVNFSTFHVADSELELAPDPLHPDQKEVFHARVSSLLPGFHVGFISDLRLCKFLNLRFCPGMMFTSRTISYKTESGRPVPDKGAHIDVLAMPVYLPLYLKWSAEREGNYRPYVIAGGGASFNVSRDREKPILLNLMDYFCEVGFGVDLYFRWFKFCPEITYRIGFANQLAPAQGRMELPPYETFYTDAISRLTSHSVCLTFNFE